MRGLRLIPLVWLVLLAACVVWAAPARKSSPRASASKAKTVQKSTKGKAKAGNTRYRRASSRRRRAVRRGPPAQQAPTVERYLEIERALADKGYLPGEPDGKWDEHSVDAVRRYQDDHQIDGKGKLTALTLITLGLGPQRTSLPLPSPAPPAPPEPPAQTPGTP